MAFDPMTGEPIEDSVPDDITDEVKGGIDGAKEENRDDGEGMRFDPMTGEPIGQQPGPGPSGPAGGFDPMTGEPIGQQPGPGPSGPAGGFDPMTGEPIGQQPGPGPSGPAGGFDPMTGKPIGSASQQKDEGRVKNKKLPLFIGIGAAVAAAVVFLIVAAASGLFMGGSGKVMMAAANTFKDTPHFVKALEPLALLAGDHYTVAFSCKVDDLDMKVSGEARVNGKEKQISALLDYDGTDIEFLGGVHTDTVRLQVPELSKYVFTYHFKDENTGYLADELGDDIEILNTALETIAEGDKEARAAQKELVKVFVDEWEHIKFTGAEKKEYTIDDKDVTCKGYQAVITSDDMVRVVDRLEDVMNDNFAAFFDEAMFDEDDLEDVFDELRDGAEYMEDIELTFYIYKNKLAAIIMSVEDETAELCFEGGDYRMQNMTLKMDQYRVQLSGSENDTKETFTLKARYGRQSEEIGTLKYDHESGKFSVDIDGSGLSGKLIREGSSLTVKVNEVYDPYYSFSPGLELTIKKGAKIAKYSGKEFDLGNADEDEIMDLVDSMEDRLYDSDLGYLLEDLYYW